MPVISGLMVSKLESLNPVVQDRFPGGKNMHLLFNFDIVNLLLKTKGGGGGGRRSNFVLFVVGSDFIVSELLVVTHGGGAESLV